MKSYRYEQPTFRNGLIAKAGTKLRTSDELPSFASQYIPTLPQGAVDSYTTRESSPSLVEWQRIYAQSLNILSGVWSRARRLRLSSFLDLRLLAVTIWMLVIWWREEGLFQSHISNCNWHGWEDWVRAPNQIQLRVLVHLIVYRSLLMRILIMSSSLPILSLSIRILILADCGHCPP